MAERDHWDDYQDAYEDMIRNTATKRSPWYVVPADKKWFTWVVVSAAVIDTLVSLDLAYPEVDSARLTEITNAKKVLLQSK
jgi:polyphosphate kinase 2 (PPK2 family)